MAFEEKLSGSAAWKWVFFRAWDIDALAPGDDVPGAFGIEKVRESKPLLCLLKSTRIFSAGRVGFCM